MNPLNWNNKDTYTYTKTLKLDLPAMETNTYYSDVLYVTYEKRHLLSPSFSTFTPLFTPSPYFPHLPSPSPLTSLSFSLKLFLSLFSITGSDACIIQYL